MPRLRNFHVKRVWHPDTLGIQLRNRKLLAPYFRMLEQRLVLERLADV